MKIRLSSFIKLTVFLILLLFVISCQQISNLILPEPPATRAITKESSNMWTETPSPTITAIPPTFTPTPTQTIESTTTPTSPRPRSWEELRRELEVDYGVEIIFDEVQFPIEWGLYAGTYDIVPTEYRLVALEDLSIDLGKYDPDFIRANLDRIYIVDYLAFLGYEYGGTIHFELLWLYIHRLWLGDDSSWADASGFHHEFSSILMYTYPHVFSQTEWIALNPSDFQYWRDQSGWENIASGRIGLIGDEEDYSIGFLCEYGQLTFEEDINTYAQYLIAKPELLEEIMLQYPIVEQKALLLEGFYSQIGHMP